ncbi:MAG: Omp28-related outer membrane protein [candidate division WOR-3 bacterium]
MVAVGLLVAAGCSDAPLVPLVPTNRIVLAEFFTWQRCVYCPYAAHALDSLVREFKDSVVVIAYHRRVAGDTLSPEYVERRRAFYYETGGEPATVFDGGEVVRTPGPQYNYPTFRNYILGARSSRPLAQIAVEADVSTDTIRVVVRLWGVDSTPAETLRLLTVITEDSIRATQTGATDSVFNSVMRALLPDPEGRPVVISRAETSEVAERLPLAGFWRRDRLAVVAFIQQGTTRKVLQAARTPVLERR